MAIFTNSILRDAAQEGAFYGSFNPGNKKEIEARARNIQTRGSEGVFSSPIDLRNGSQVKVIIKTDGGACQGISNGISNTIQVNVIYEYPFIMPFIGLIAGAETITLTGSASNVILQPPCQ